MSQPTEKFQNAVIDAINKAAANDVHPAIVYTVLSGYAADVLLSIKKMNAQPHPRNPPTSPPTNGGSPQGATQPENVTNLHPPAAAQ